VDHYNGKEVIMPIYNNVNELLTDAVNRGIIRLTGLDIKIGSLEIHSPTGAINVIKPDDWRNFLQHIVNNSDEEAEVNQAMLFLNMFQQVEYARQSQIKNFRQNPIDEIDVNTLTKQLENCVTIDDILKTIDDNLLSKSLPTSAIVNGSPNLSNTCAANAPMIKTENTVNFRWKKPVNVNGKSRYCSYDTDWYIERQELKSPNGGLIIYFSIFSPDGREKARFDRLKDAKTNMAQTIKQLS